MTAGSQNVLYDQSPPNFGHAMCRYFGFDPKYINLNNGSYGVLPLPVRAACDNITTQIESNPDLFHRLQYQPLLRHTRQRVAKLIGADTDECVMVPNATHGINTVLRNFEWHEGDVIIEASTTYGAISRTIQYLGDIPPHPTLSTFNISFPTTSSAIISRFREHLRSIPRHGPLQKVVAIVDSIISNPGILLPWKEMVAICREEGVWSVVDAAHSIGQEIGINLGEAKPDFWVSNCHKWLFAKRGCAVLYIPERNRQIIKSSIPTSHSYVSPSDSPDVSSFIAQFEWNGTIDFAPYLSVSAALEFRNWIGGEENINSYCHSLALAGGIRLAELLGTRVMDEAGDMTANMVNVELPLPKRTGESMELEINTLLRHKLLEEWNIYAAHFYHNGKWWVRCSAQIWTEMSDFEVLGKALSAICSQITEVKVKTKM